MTKNVDGPGEAAVLVTLTSNAGRNQSEPWSSASLEIGCNEEKKMANKRLLAEFALERLSWPPVLPRSLAHEAQFPHGPSLKQAVSKEIQPNLSADGRLHWQVSGETCRW